MKVAVKAVLDFIEEEKFPKKVVFVLFGEKDYSIYESYLEEIFKDI